MAKEFPYTWRPRDIVEVTNVSGEHFLLELDSGQLRLDSGRTLRMTECALHVPQVMTLVNAGKLKVKPYRWK